MAWPTIATRAVYVGEELHSTQKSKLGWRISLLSIIDFARAGISYTDDSWRIEMSENSDSNAAVMELTAEVVAAFVGNNSVPANELPALIASVHSALQNVGQPAAATPVEVELKPAVSIRKSVTPDFIICLEDGLKFKSLKRHLRTKYDLTPDAYRAKWGLPNDYPMVAPSYAEARSNLAKQMGLGQQRKKPVIAPPKKSRTRAPKPEAV